MPNNAEIVGPIQTVPPEILLKIFSYLPAKELMKSRQICRRWKVMVDRLADNSATWENFCKRDFESYLVVARRKIGKDHSWYDLYRSLSLWPKLGNAVEEHDEFSPAGEHHLEVRSVQILRDGRISVHKKGGIHYYGADSFQPYCHCTITGDYARYVENDRVIVIQSFYLHLFVVRKFIQNVNEDLNATFDNVKLFFLSDDELHYVTVPDEIYVVNTCKEPVTSVFVTRTENREAIMAIGTLNGSLNVLTYQQNIYTVVNKKLVFKQKATSELNTINTLFKYNLLDQLDWRAFYQWMVSNRTYPSIPQGPSRDILVTRRYGDIYLVGTMYGVLQVYYRPFINGALDFFNAVPVRQVNYMTRSDIPVLSNCPIVDIEVCETETGHNILVAMPKKVAVLKYNHSCMKSAKWAFKPYSEMLVGTYVHMSCV